MPHRKHRNPSSEILRFQWGERLVHWSIALPFIICYLSAVVLVLVYNPDPQRPHRAIFATVHRASGICLFALPTLAILIQPRFWRLHLTNIFAAWIWTFDELKWLLLMAPAAIFKRIKLPEPGKFNAAEKINFMVVMISGPIFILTGLLIWLPQVKSFYPWIAHVVLAGIITPLMFGHIFMATINPSTRVGLKGMITGFVSRHWAAHHYPRWFRKHHASENDEMDVKDGKRRRAPDQDEVD